MYGYFGIKIGIEVVSWALWLFLLMRFGLLALALAFFVQYMLRSNLITLDASAWYAPYGYATLAMLAVIVLYASRTSPGGQPIFGRSSLEDWVLVHLPESIIEVEGGN
jgi:hypothetical protein